MSRACTARSRKPPRRKFSPTAPASPATAPPADSIPTTRPFLSTDELLADLAAPPTIAPNTRFKYSNHGFGLLGLVIEAITGEPYRAWIEREIVDAVGLARNPIRHAARQKASPFARGHTPRLPVGRRLVVPGEYLENAISAGRRFRQHGGGCMPLLRATGAQCQTKRAVRRQPPRNDAHGTGAIRIRASRATTASESSAAISAGWDWFGHSGGLQGYISRTCVIPSREVTISILTNATDGWAGFWLDGAMHIMRAFATRGAPKRRVRDWTGRWWSSWGAVDLVPMGNLVIAGNPHAFNPFLDATEIEVTGRDTGRISLAAGYGSHGEAVRRTRNKAGKVTEVWFAGGKVRAEKAVAAEMERRYGPRKRRPAR